MPTQLTDHLANATSGINNIDNIDNNNNEDDNIDNNNNNKNVILINNNKNNEKHNINTWRKQMTNKFYTESKSQSLTVEKQYNSEKRSPVHQISRVIYPQTLGASNRSKPLVTIHDSTISATVSDSVDYCKDTASGLQMPPKRNTVYKGLKDYNSSVHGDENAPFLVNSNAGDNAKHHSNSNNNRRYGSSSNSGNNNNNNNNHRASSALCYWLRNVHSVLNYLVLVSILGAVIFVAYSTRDYAKGLLYWIQLQNHWIIFTMYLLLFVVVSFPVVIGYFILMITAGYLFGCIKGLVTVLLGANIGIAIAHVILRWVRHRLPLQRFIKNDTARAILRVIAGPRAFRVVLFTRLTPIPFGLQNIIFGISNINPRVYHTATFLGLLPAQLFNVYLGSTLRSMQEVFNNNNAATMGYISFTVEVLCGIGLMFWVVQKARKELSHTLLNDIGDDGTLIDIQV